MAELSIRSDSWHYRYYLWVCRVWHSKPKTVNDRWSICPYFHFLFWSTLSMVVFSLPALLGRTAAKIYWFFVLIRPTVKKEFDYMHFNETNDCFLAWAFYGVLSGGFLAFLGLLGIGIFGNLHHILDFIFTLPLTLWSGVLVAGSVIYEMLGLLAWTAHWLYSVLVAEIIAIGVFSILFLRIVVGMVVDYLEARTIQKSMEREAKLKQPPVKAKVPRTRAQIRRELWLTKWLLRAENALRWLQRLWRVTRYDTEGKVTVELGIFGAIWEFVKKFKSGVCPIIKFVGDPKPTEA